MSEKPVAGGIGSGDNPTDRYKPSDITNLCKLLNDGLAKVEDGSVFARRIRLVQTEVQHAFKRINNLRDRKRSRVHDAQGRRFHQAQRRRGSVSLESDGSHLLRRKDR